MGVVAERRAVCAGSGAARKIPRPALASPQEAPLPPNQRKGIGYAFEMIHFFHLFISLFFLATYLYKEGGK